jgi:acyl-CoA synthetase (AMP-forming)/AMP-acid ligase II
VQADCSSYRYPDDQAGELPVAFIVSRSGSILHEAQIKEFVAKRVYASIQQLYNQ